VAGDTGCPVERDRSRLDWSSKVKKAANRARPSARTNAKPSSGRNTAASERGPPAEPGWQGSTVAPSENPVTRR
jgi:hypothetical protein